MIYCVGKQVLYEGYFENEKRPMKRVGSSVWRTEEEAKAYCSAGYKVYRVFADWESDTVPSQDGNWHSLLINAEIIPLDDF